MGVKSTIQCFRQLSSRLRRPHSSFIVACMFWVIADCVKCGACDLVHGNRQDFFENDKINSWIVYEFCFCMNTLSITFSSSSNTALLGVERKVLVSSPRCAAKFISSCFRTNQGSPDQVQRQVNEIMNFCSELTNFNSPAKRVSAD